MPALILCSAFRKEENGQNPLLEKFDTPFETPPFDKIRLYRPAHTHGMAAFDQAIAEARQEIQAIVENPEAPDFENTIAALDRAGERLNAVSSIFFNLNSACTGEEMQKIAQQVSPKLTAYGNSVSMNPQLFARVKQVYANTSEASLTTEQFTLLEDTYKSFIRGGANLEEAEKERYEAITMELSQLGLQFDENVLAETNDFTLHLTDPGELSGLPESALEAAALAAKEKGLA